MFSFLYVLGVFIKQVSFSSIIRQKKGSGLWNYMWKAGHIRSQSLINECVHEYKFDSQIFK